jgi:hypothetical protein
MISVAPFSPAYFAVARALPELSESLGVGESLVIAGRRMSIKVVAGGKQSLSEADLRDLVRDFRGGV